jgi:hypothetical protein
VGFNQHMNGNFAREPELHTHPANVIDHLPDIVGTAWLGQGEIGQTISCAAQKNVEVLLPTNVARVVYPRSSHAKDIGVAVEHAHDHLGMFFFPARWSAVFTITGNVKNGSHGFLQREGLADEFFVTREVLASGEGGEGGLAGKQGVPGMNRMFGAVGRVHFSLSS